MRTVRAEAQVCLGVRYDELVQLRPILALLPDERSAISPLIQQQHHSQIDIIQLVKIRRRTKALKQKLDVLVELQ